MQVIRGIHNLRGAHHGCVATIGNFDGVHLGHQAVLRDLLNQSARLHLPSTVITFEPQPQEYFAPERAPARLTRLREKLYALAETGIDRVLILEFNVHFAAIPAVTFVEQVLVRSLGVRLLFVGDDFRFGQNREGDCNLLRALGIQYGFAVETRRTVCFMAERISSTRVREVLMQDQLKIAADLLGRRYRLHGRVIHGAKRGRAIGFPTVNINLHRRVSPLHGVFTVRVSGLNLLSWPGVANIGTRPSVTGSTQYLLEVHLFDFNGDLYGAHLAVEPVDKLRNEQRFASFAALRQQIAQDAAQARQLLQVSSL